MGKEVWRIKRALILALLKSKHIITMEEILATNSSACSISIHFTNALFYSIGDEVLLQKSIILCRLDTPSCTADLSKYVRTLYFALFN